MWLSVVLLAVLVPVWSCDSCIQVLPCPGAYKRSPVDSIPTPYWPHEAPVQVGQALGDNATRYVCSINILLYFSYQVAYNYSQFRCLAVPPSGTWLTSCPEPNGRSTCHRPNSQGRASSRCSSNNCGHCGLASWYVLHLFSLFLFLFTDTPLWRHCCVRAPLSKAKSASRAMCGRPATLMRTLQWLATGLRSACPESGPLRPVCSGLFKWTQPIMAHVLCYDSPSRAPETLAEQWHDKGRWPQKMCMWYRTWQSRDQRWD